MKVKDVKYLQDYLLQVIFEDGTKRIIDFHSFLMNAKNPMTTKYRNKNFFKQVQIHNGSLTWNDEMDIHYTNIYKGIYDYKNRLAPLL